MSLKTKDKISFILYEENKIPSYHQFKPKIYKLLIYGPTILTLLSAIVLAGSYFYSKNVEQLIRSHEPEIIKTLRAENILLREKASELSSLNKEFTKKLSSTVPTTSLESLSIVAPVTGQRDLTSPANIKIQDILPTISANKVFFNFNIINITKNNTKLAGFIHIFVTDGSSYYHYPEMKSEVKYFSIPYNSGEPFATSRFRPVEATFNTFKNSPVIFKIVIFNRLGDLIHQQQFKHYFN